MRSTGTLRPTTPRACSTACSAFRGTRTKTCCPAAPRRWRRRALAALQTAFRRCATCADAVEKRRRPTPRSPRPSAPSPLRSAHRRRGSGSRGRAGTSALSIHRPPWRKQSPPLAAGAGPPAAYTGAADGDGGARGAVDKHAADGDKADDQQPHGHQKRAAGTFQHRQRLGRQIGRGRSGRRVRIAHADHVRRGRRRRPRGD